jgi:periplasmic divalent cation tolerance protein
MPDVHILFSTVDNLQTARKIASTLVEERLAACVNILPGVSSCYRWQGEIQHEQEFLLILKTSTDRRQSLMERLASIHPYEVPEILSIPSEGGHASYVDWILSETSG